jgi:TonB-dependent SusC/RagA subfamily outer membrane receptor
MSPESIEKIEVIKGEAARALYDHPRAANGVIIITTKPRRR